MATQQRIGTTATTVAASTPGFINVTYHQTVVVSFSDSAIILRSGGYRTATTKTRMNQTSNQFGLRYLVYAKAGQWFVDFDGATVPFTDGMVLHRL
jgi:hypothetical protein